MSELWRVVVIFGLSLWLGFTGAVLPGPMFAATVMHARRWGWRSGVLVSAGHGLLELVPVIAIVFGAGAVLSSPVVSRTVAIIGGLFLAVLGIMAIARPPMPPQRDADVVKAEAGLLSAGARGPFLAGIWTSVSQPYWFLWWASFGLPAVYAASGNAGAVGVSAFYAGHVLSDVIWFTFVAAAVGAGRRILPDSAFRKLFVACGAMLIGFGMLFASTGVFFPNALRPKEKSPPAAESDASATSPSVADTPERVTPP